MNWYWWLLVGAGITEVSYWAGYRVGLRRGLRRNRSRVLADYRREMDSARIKANWMKAGLGEAPRTRDVSIKPTSRLRSQVDLDED